MSSDATAHFTATLSVGWPTPAAQLEHVSMILYLSMDPYQHCRSQSFFGSGMAHRHSNYAPSLRLIQAIASSGKFHPGQIVITDYAFTWYKDLHLTVTEVIDHGLHHVVSEATQVTFKEILPNCLPGRVSSAFKPSPEVQKLSHGFHDAPALPGPMCICFCNITVPQVRSACF